MDRKSMELKKYLLKIVKIKKLFLEAIYEDILHISSIFLYNYSPCLDPIKCKNPRNGATLLIVRRIFLKDQQLHN